MKRFEEVLLSEKPDFVVLVGDVNSTVACALVTAKMSFDAAGSRPLIVHVEAGLRSFDRTMPEEINRVLTDHVSDLLFVTEASGLENLRREGIPPGRIHLAGNTMIDSLLAFKDQAEASKVLETLGLRVRTEDGVDTIRRYALMTLHRPANVDNRAALLHIAEGIEELASVCPIVFPVHPRTRRRIEEFDLKGLAGADVMLTDPMGYLNFLCVMQHAALVVTDSGGIQEETTCLGIPCVTVRENTERPVTLTSGTNVLAGTTREGIRAAIRRQLRSTPNGSVPEKWDGRAAGRILDVVIRTYEERAASQSRPISDVCA